MGKHHYKCLACGRQEACTSGVKYFRIPVNKERRTKWLSAIHKSYLINEKMSADFRICENHFSEEMYIQSKYRLRLKYTATPTNVAIFKTAPDYTQGKFDQYIDKANLEVLKKEDDSCEISKSVRVPIEIIEAGETLSEIIHVGGFDVVPIAVETETAHTANHATWTNYKETEENPITIFEAETEIKQEVEIEAIPAQQKSKPPEYPSSLLNESSLECTTITDNNDSPFPRFSDSSFRQNNTTFDQQNDDDGAQSEGSEKSTDWEKQNKTAIQCVTKVLKVTANRDKYSVFGEVLAQNIRNSCKDLVEIDTAKKHIENVLTNLLSGVYNQGTVNKF